MEEGYSGPRWEEGELSSEFMSDLLQWLKDEKKLHRKYAYKVRGRRRGEGGEGKGFCWISHSPTLSPSPSPSSVDNAES